MGHIHILVVDDNEAHCEALSELIEDQPIYKSYKATTCNEALKLFCPNKFSIAFIDLSLEGSVTNGIKLIQSIRKLDQKIYIVVVTAYPDLIYNKILIECVDDFIQKPIESQFFQSKLFLWCSKYEKRGKMLRYIQENNDNLESRISSYETKLEAIRSIDYQINQLTERMEASIPGEDDWFMRS